MKMDMVLVSLFDTLVGNGCFGFSILAITRIGEEINSSALLGISYTRGVGFTMDLFWMPVL